VSAQSGGNNVLKEEKDETNIGAARTKLSAVFRNVFKHITKTEDPNREITHILSFWSVSEAVTTTGKKTIMVAAKNRMIQIQGVRLAGITM
jgi:hypothetical protein